MICNAFSRNGELLAPNTTRLNRYTSISGSGEVVSFTQRNRRQSLSASSTSMLRDTFDMSPTIATLTTLNLLKVSKMRGLSDGPTCRQLFNDVSVEFSLQEVSKNNFTLVVSDSYIITLECLKFEVFSAIFISPALEMIPASSCSAIFALYSARSSGTFLNLLIWLFNLATLAL